MFKFPKNEINVTIKYENVPAEKPSNVPRTVVVNQFGAIISTED